MMPYHILFFSTSQSFQHFLENIQLLPGSLIDSYVDMKHSVFCSVLRSDKAWSPEQGIYRIINQFPEYSYINLNNPVFEKEQYGLQDEAYWLSLEHIGKLKGRQLMSYYETSDKDGRTLLRFKAIDLAIKDRERIGPGPEKDDVDLDVLADQQIKALQTSIDPSVLTDDLEAFKKLFREYYKVGYRGQDAAERILERLDQ